MNEVLTLTLKRLVRSILPLETMGTIALYRIYVRTFGLLRGFLAYYKISNTRQGLLGISIPQSRSKILLRAGTSDVQTFEQIFVGKDYEIDSASKPSLIIDGGANIGCAAVYFANRYPAAQIVALEPEESNFELLEKNTSSYPNITALQSGIWNKKGFLRVENPNDDKWAFRVTETERADGAIEAVTVDDILNLSKAESIDILKLDIEGAEKEVFSSSKSWLDKVRMLIVELHDRYKPGCSQSFYSALSDFDFAESRKGENVIMVRQSLNAQPGNNSGHLLRKTQMSDSDLRVETTAGVSVVICCHNSAARLPETLAYLSRQELHGGIRAEIIVIDNASSDHTAQVARECWPQDCCIPLRIIHEPQLGLSHARDRGFRESKYEFVCFVDDDNWVCSEWIQVVAETMSHHPEVGACGGFVDSVFEATPPWWFQRYKSSYAPEAQGQPEGGDVTWRRFLMGAGLTIRKSAWKHIMNNGFNFLLVDRQGAQLTAGGDIEICHALCLAGWRLWYEPRLRMQHFLPAGRLNWSLLRLQARGAGKCEAGLDPYRYVLEEQQTRKAGAQKLFQQIKQSWQWQTLLSIRYMAPHPLKLITSLYYPWEGDYHVIWLERQIGRLSGLLERRKTYQRNFQRIRRAAWVNGANSVRKASV